MKRRFDVKIAVNVFLICLLSLLMVSVAPAFGKKIAGVDVPQSATIENKVLVLNGAGIRKKLFIKVYVGSLYLTVKQTAVGKILADPGVPGRPCRVLRHRPVVCRTLVPAGNETYPVCR